MSANLLGPDHTRLRGGRLDAHAFVPNGHGLRLFSRRARRIARLLAALGPADLGNLNSLRLGAGVAGTGSAARLALLATGLCAAALLPRLLAALRATAALLRWLALRTLRLARGASTLRQTGWRIALLAATTLLVGVLRAADFSTPRVFIPGQFKIPDHAVFGFFFGGLRRAVEQSRVRQLSSCAARARGTRSLSRGQRRLARFNARPRIVRGGSDPRRANQKRDCAGATANGGKKHDWD